MCQAARDTRTEDCGPSNACDSSTTSTKSRKRQQAELKAQLRAKRNRSVNSLCTLSDQEKQVEARKKVSKTEVDVKAACYRAVLAQGVCPHLSKWMAEEPSVGITWDFERYYRASETRVVEDEGLLSDALAFLVEDREAHERTQVIAIDLEWRPDRIKAANNPVALIQLATTTRCVLLRTVTWDTSGRSGLPRALAQFFSEASNRYFVGFSWESGDEKKMQSSFGVGKDVFSNFCDLQELAQLLGYGKKCGLAWLTKEVVGAELPKTTARSNWEAALLSAEQEKYGALDAFSLHAILAGWRVAGGL